jgi:hypothetical protein
MLGLGLGITKPFEGEAFVGLLDTYSGAEAAVSLRRLTASYSGAAITVRESGGNTTADIGFDANGNLDTAALLLHCGGSNGFVTDWYDQSGNNRRFSQGSASKQPQIVDSGSVITAGAQGKPALRFVKSEANEMDFGTTITGVDDWYFVSAIESNQGTSSSTGVLINSNSNENDRIRITSGGDTQVRIFGGASFTASSALTNGTGAIYAVQRDGSDNISQFINAGSAVGTGTKSDDWPAFRLLGRNQAGGNALFLNSDVQELIFYNSIQSSRVAIETDLKNYYVG